MFLLDADILTLLHHGHPRVTERAQQAADEIALTVITQIEVLQGRFDFMLKAADQTEWLRAQALLSEWERVLGAYRIVRVDQPAGMEFEKLRAIRSLRKIGRADLLIACIALANRATLVTRNVKDFKQVPGLQFENWAD